jgi:hypothetical protein
MVVAGIVFVVAGRYAEAALTVGLGLPACVALAIHARQTPDGRPELDDYPALVRLGFGVLSLLCAVLLGALTSARPALLLGLAVAGIALSVTAYRTR